MNAVLCSAADGVATLTLNRPESRNALNLEMCELLLKFSLELASSDDVRLVLVKANGPVFCAGADLKEREGMGAAQVRETFKVPKYGTIAGCMVTEGRITRSGDTQARLLRDNVVIYEGKIGSLRRFKDDASEVKAGLECGIGFERFNDIKVGDVIEVFVMERVGVPA